MSCWIEICVEGTSEVNAKLQLRKNVSLQQLTRPNASDGWGRLCTGYLTLKWQGLGLLGVAGACRACRYPDYKSALARCYPTCWSKSECLFTNVGLVCFGRISFPEAWQRASSTRHRHHLSVRRRRPPPRSSPGTLPHHVSPSLISRQAGLQLFSLLSVRQVEQAFPHDPTALDRKAASHAGSTPLPQHPSSTLCPAHPPAPANHAPRERSFHRQSLQIPFESRTAPLGCHWTRLKRLARVQSREGLELIALCAYTTHARSWRNAAGGRLLGGDEFSNRCKSPTVTAKS